MDLADVSAVIESAKARGTEPLRRFVEGRLPEASPRDVEGTVEVAVEIIDSLPVLLARAWQEAGTRNVETVVEPILRQATEYLVTPVDVIPEMTRGLAGLLDDAYLVLQLLEHLDGGEEPFLDWELGEPITFLARILGPEYCAELDEHGRDFIHRAETHFSEAWTSFSAEA